MLIVLYLIVAAAVVYASIKASQYIDLIDRTTKLSGAFLGGVLLSAITSLPELFTSLSATLVLKKPSMSIGNILGSNLFNIAMLSAVFLLAIRSVRRVSFARGNIMVSIYLILIYAVMALDYTGILRFDIGTVNVITFIFIGIYALAVRHLSGDSPADAAEDEEPVAMSLRTIVVRFVLAGTAIVGLSIVMTYVTDAVAIQYNIGEGFAGALLLGVATSLPEVSSTIALFRIKNYDIAVGNIVGSNLFNFLVLCIADIASFRDSIYVYDDGKVVALLLFGGTATLLTLPMLKIRSGILRGVCAVAIFACYIAFLLIK